MDSGVKNNSLVGIQERQDLHYSHGQPRFRTVSCHSRELAYFQDFSIPNISPTVKDVLGICKKEGSSLRV